jgi:hypothetical protein
VRYIHIGFRVCGVNSTIHTSTSSDSESFLKDLQHSFAIISYISLDPMYKSKEFTSKTVFSNFRKVKLKSKKLPRSSSMQNFKAVILCYKVKPTDQYLNRKIKPPKKRFFVRPACTNVGPKTLQDTMSRYWKLSVSITRGYLKCSRYVLVL